MASPFSWLLLTIPFFQTPASEYLGLLIKHNHSYVLDASRDQIVVVEFDTFPNEGDVGDPPYQHVGINVNSMTPLSMCWLVG